MNRDQLKQYLQNNLWWGENDHLKIGTFTQPVTAALVQPDYKRTWGIDISGRWDGVVDLSVTKLLGASFVIIKGVDGTINTPYYVENYNNAVKANLPRSSYAWLYRNANVPCAAQAQAFDTLLNKYPPSSEIPAVIDFENTRWGGVVESPNFDDLRKWVSEWLRLGNPKPLLYSGKYFMDQYGAMPNDLKDMFDGIWIANYGVTSPGLPLGWKDWRFWQFAATGDALFLAPGTTGKKELDLNYSAYTITPEPPPTGGTMETWIIKEGVSLKVRSGPATTYPQIDGLAAGDKVEGVFDAISGWIHISKIMRVNGTQKAIDGWCSGNAIYVEKVTQPPPPVVTITSIDIQLAKGSTVTTKKSDGTEKVEIA